MPISFDGHRYHNWKAAARAVMKKKGWSLKRANAYVAGIEKRQGGGVRYKGRKSRGS